MATPVRLQLQGTLRGVAIAAAALLAASIGSQLSAQAKPRGAQSPGIELPKRLFLDSVVASVNDSAILQSKLFQTSMGTINGEIASGRNLSFNDVRSITVRDLRALVSDFQMALSARSFGNFPPDRFEMILRGEIEREKQARVDDLGTSIAVSEELARQGQTWQTYSDGLKIEKLQMLAKEFAIHARLRKQSNLHLTPRMLRETFAEMKGQLAKELAAMVAMVAFSGPEAAKNAAEAAKFWRTGDWDAGEVAERFPNAIKLLNLPARTLPPELKAFGLAGPIGNVSEPIPAGGGLIRVAKIMQFTKAYTPSFEDPEVQAKVRETAAMKVFYEFRKHAHERARDRTEVWIYEKGRRKQFQMR